MKESNVAIDKLQRIQELWGELGRTKLDSPEYETLLADIRGLSTEYQTLVDSIKKEKAKRQTA
jgi:hypothetical protein